MRLPFLTETTLSNDPETALAQVEEAIASDTPHGYVRAYMPASERFLFLLSGKVHSAGELSGDTFAQCSIRETVASMSDMKRAVLCKADVGLLLCLAVPFRRAPSAQVPASLVDPQSLLESVRKSGDDAVLVVRRRDARSVAFCRNGELETLYPAAGEPFPKEGSIADRIVEYVYSDSPEDTTLDIYREIRLPPTRDAGRPLTSYLRERASEPPPDLQPLAIVVKLSGRVVFHYRMTKKEITIGRAHDADLVLDNISVSREHARIERKGNQLLVVDLGGKNGIVQGGQRKEQAVLNAGDSVSVGKYSLELFEGQLDSGEVDRRSFHDRRLSAFQETMYVEPDGGLAIHHRGERYRLKLLLNIGKTPNANVVINGWFIAPVHAQIVQQDDGSYHIVHVEGRRKLKLNGNTVTEAPLAAGDRFTIGRHEFLVRRANEQ